MTYKKKDDPAELVKTHSYTSKFNFYLYLPTAKVIYTFHIGKQIMKRNIKKRKKKTGSGDKRREFSLNFGHHFHLESDGL